LLIERDWYELGKWNLEDGQCRSCGCNIAGVFEEQRGDWGARRLRVRLALAQPDAQKTSNTERPTSNIEVKTLAGALF
jgi:hypothetical protein